MDDKQRSKTIVKAVIIAGIFIVTIIIALAMLLALAFERTSQSIEETNKRLDSIQSLSPEVDYVRLNTMVADAIEKMPAPKDGEDGRSIVGQKGEDAQVDYLYLSKLIQESVKDQVSKLPKPKDGLDGTSPPQIEFDRKGHWRLSGDDEWLPLFEGLVKDE